MKYIVYQDGTAVVFPDFANHKDMVGNKLATSAGYCRVETYRDAFDDVKAKVSCWGKSDTLNLQSRGASDEELIARIFRQS